MQLLHFAVSHALLYPFLLQTANTATCTNCKHAKTIMAEYRFTLQKYRHGNKGVCPNCGRRHCFVRYIDTEGRIEFPDYVGRCDHEQSCQYHYKPSDYFKDNPDALESERNEQTFRPIVVPVSKSQPTTSYIDNDVMRRTLTVYPINPLYRFLSTILGVKETLRIFQLYKVGTSKKWGGSTVYWQIDHLGRVRAGKIMLYNAANGHRVKEPRSYVSWVHSELCLTDFNMKQCLFGEHLLPVFPTKPVAIVESEKSALIATHFMPDFLWLATGGIHGCFKTEVMEVLRGRQVMVFPDLGAYDVWREKSAMLHAICEKVVVSQHIEQTATAEQRAKGLDLADFLLMTDTPTTILQKMINRHPCLKTLIDALGLELVDVD